MFYITLHYITKQNTKYFVHAKDLITEQSYWKLVIAWSNGIFSMHSEQYLVVKNLTMHSASVVQKCDGGKCRKKIMIAMHCKCPQTTFCIPGDSIFRLFANIHAEHDNLRGHCRHLVVETVLVHSVRMSRECVLAIALTITRIYSFAIWSRNLNTASAITDKPTGTGDFIMSRIITENTHTNRKCKCT